MISSFNRDYYENGITKGVSGYENYHYIPERSYSEAVSILNHCRIASNDTILDYGCAKGFLVHSLRQLGVNAYGEDVSEYALGSCKPEIRKYLQKPNNDLFYDYIVCKDVMEHVPEEDVLTLLKSLSSRCRLALFVIPLGDNNKFRIREYEIDKTHVTKKNEDYWINKLKEAGFKVDRFSYHLGSVKKKWTSKYDYGNGFFQVYTK